MKDNYFKVLENDIENEYKNRNKSTKDNKRVSIPMILTLHTKYFLPLSNKIR